jgi:hypothetical protein
MPVPFSNVPVTVTTTATRLMREVVICATTAVIHTSIIDHLERADSMLCMDKDTSIGCDHMPLVPDFGLPCAALRRTLSRECASNRIGRRTKNGIERGNTARGFRMARASDGNAGSAAWHGAC